MPSFSTMKYSRFPCARHATCPKLIRALVIGIRCTVFLIVHPHPVIQHQSTFINVKYNDAMTFAQEDLETFQQREMALGDK
jgi:hypothetical protein